MDKRIVVCLSVGSSLLVLLATGIVSTAILLSGCNLNPQPDSQMIRPFQPKTGVMGELNRLKNEIDLGPVNLDAAKEVKNGGLFARIRANRQARQQCQPCQTSQTVVSACQFQNAPIVVDPSDCNYSQTLATTSVQSIVLQSTGVEMQSVVPPKEIEKAFAKDCVTCKTTPRTELKTGSFICSNCRKSQVGNWHTEWNDAGQPITFLCETCFHAMSPEQRDKAYRGYIARQTKTVGQIGLLHPELGQ
jgi:hypothetical protein